MKELFFSCCQKYVILIDTLSALTPNVNRVVDL